jgi:hypothetical protein
MKTATTTVRGSSVLLVCLCTTAVGNVSGQSNPPVGPGASSRWSIAEEATIRLSDASGAPPELFSVRGALALGSGRIVVADATPRLIFFNADGSYHRTVGRRGRGPGEFQQISWIARIQGDSIVVAEPPGSARVSVFGPDGEFVRLLTIPGPSIANFYGAFSDGTLLGGFQSPFPSSAPVAFVQTDAELIRFDAAGRVLRRLGRVPVGDFIRVPGGLISPTFLKKTEIVVRAMEAYITSGEGFEVRVVTADGQDGGTVGAPFQVVPFPAREAVRALAGSRFEGVVTERNLSGWPRNQSYPATAGVQIDDEGNIWLRGYQPDDQLPSTWTVFNQAGAVIADVVMPPRIWPFHIGADFVIVRVLDELDVPYVEVRRLVKR